MTTRELATVLAALSYWQRMTTPEERTNEAAVWEAVYFMDERPLSDQQIDALKERLNMTPAAGKAAAS